MDTPRPLFLFGWGGGLGLPAGGSWCSDWSLPGTAPCVLRVLLVTVAVSGCASPAVGTPDLLELNYSPAYFPTCDTNKYWVSGSPGAGFCFVAGWREKPSQLPSWNPGLE